MTAQKGPTEKLVDPIVFVVDDDASMRKALTNLICSVGFQVQAFSSCARLSKSPTAVDAGVPGAGCPFKRA